MRAAVVLVALALTACQVTVNVPTPKTSSSPKTTASASPDPKATPDPDDRTLQTLSGAWEIGIDTPEPPAGVVHPACGRFGYWSLAVDGTAVTQQQSCGLCPKNPSETASGTLEGKSLKLTGDHTFELTFDEKTHHLVGTRDGKPFWAAPLGKVVPVPGRACPSD